MEVSVKVNKPTEEKLTFEIREATTGEGKGYKIIDAEDYQIAIFPNSKQADPTKGSHLVANARITLKKAGITFQTPVKKLRDSGELLAGQPARLNGHRAVVSEWVSDKDGNGMPIPGKGESFERMSIPNSVYKEIMALIAAATE